MLNNKKIKRIRTMPEGNNIILIWVFLLTAAGESNKNGGLFLTDTLPFKEDDLAIEFDFDVEIIRFALITLEKFGMIEVYESVIYIKNWSEYQNIDGLEKIREQTRARVARHREIKQLQQSNATSNVTVTQSNAIDIDKELDKDKEYIPYQEIMDNFHLICVSLPNIKEITPPRKKAINGKWKQLNKSIADCMEFFERVEQSDWLSGRNKEGWKASFDWIFKAANFVKIIEGNYDNKTPVINKPVRQQSKREESLDELGRMCDEFDRCRTETTSRNDYRSISSRV